MLLKKPTGELKYIEVENEKLIDYTNAVDFLMVVELDGIGTVDVDMNIFPH